MGTDPCAQGTACIKAPLTIRSCWASTMIYTSLASYNYPGYTSFHLSGTLRDKWSNPISSPLPPARAAVSKRHMLYLAERVASDGKGFHSISLRPLCNLLLYNGFPQTCRSSVADKSLRRGDGSVGLTVIFFLVGKNHWHIWERFKYVTISKQFVVRCKPFCTIW